MCVWAGVFVVTSFSASVFLTFGENMNYTAYKNEKSECGSQRYKTDT